MLYLKKPKEFNKKFDVVSCFIEHDGRFLLLHRQDHKPQGNTWGVPAGKVEKGETNVAAIIREIKEELALDVHGQDIKLMHTTFVTFAEYDFMYEIYKVVFAEKPKITIDTKDHKDFIWVSPADALKMNLIQDEDACIKLCYDHDL